MGGGREGERAPQRVRGMHPAGLPVAAPVPGRPWLGLVEGQPDAVEEAGSSVGAPRDQAVGGRPVIG